MAILGGSKVLNFDGNNVELGKYSVKTIETRPILHAVYLIGTAVSRMHRVCVLSIQDPGDSDILTAVTN